VTGDKGKEARVLTAALLLNSRISSEQTEKQSHRSSRDFVQESTEKSLFLVACNRLPVTFA
jgi:hypothetical protein